MILAYLILGIVTIIFLIVAIMMIAGKDIYFAICRRFIPKGCEVFIINNNRQISRHYKTAVEGIFKINGLMYVTNPDKILGLTDEMVKDIKISMQKSQNKIIEQIEELKLRRDFIIKQLNSLKNVPEAVPYIQQLQLQDREIIERIRLLESKSKLKEQNFYFARRGAYFYIEGDPVPKNFFDLYTEMDSIQLENVIIRAQTKDPKAVANLEKQLIFIKKVVLIVAIASAIAIFFSFKTSYLVTEMAKLQGIQFKFM